MSDKPVACIYVRKIGTDEIIHTVELHHLNEAYIDRVLNGLYHKMDLDRFYVDDNEVTKLQEMTND